MRMKILLSPILIGVTVMRRQKRWRRLMTVLLVRRRILAMKVRVLSRPWKRETSLSLTPRPYTLVLCLMIARVIRHITNRRRSMIRQTSTVTNPQATIIMIVPYRSRMIINRPTLVRLATRTFSRRPVISVSVPLQQTRPCSRENRVSRRRTFTSFRLRIRIIVGVLIPLVVVLFRRRNRRPF